MSIFFRLNLCLVLNLTKKTNANTVHELAVHGVFIFFLFFNMVDQKYCYINLFLNI